MSNIYSLLNYIAATSKEIYDVNGISHSSMIGSDHSTMYSIETGLRGYTEEERRLIGISTISVVAQLALDFQQEEVCIRSSWLSCTGTKHSFIVGYQTHNRYASPTTSCCGADG